jgi:hypothetical protein
MRYGLISIAAAIGVALAFTGAHPQASSAQATANQSPPSTQVQTVPAQCPPGVTGPCWKLQHSQGGNQLGGGSDFGIAHSPPPADEIPSCTKDSDCPPGPGRCSRNGSCMRMTIGCNADADCKFSEVCDLSQPSRPFAGLCVPRGGHY